MTPTLTADPIVYPESDGEPMAENTLQYRWIVTLNGNIDATFARDPNVFVGSDNFVYPVEGRPDIEYAPDVYVAFGRPKGDRGSYRVWDEDGIFPQVVFEVLSPSNRPAEMVRKFRFYERYGAEEYYVYDPDDDTLTVYLRDAEGLTERAESHNFVSPRIGCRFDLSGPEIVVHHADGRPYLTFQEHLVRANEAELRAERLAAKLRALGLDPDLNGH